MHIAHRGADRRGAVRDDGKLHARRHRRFQLRQCLADQIHGLDDIGIGQALHREDDRGGAVIPGGQLIIGGADRGMADIADADRRAIAVGDDRVIEPRCRAQLVIGLQGIGLALPFQDAFRIVDRRGRQRQPDILQR